MTSLCVLVDDFVAHATLALLLLLLLPGLYLLPRLVTAHCLLFQSSLQLGVPVSTALSMEVYDPLSLSSGNHRQRPRHEDTDHENLNYEAMQITAYSQTSRYTKNNVSFA